MTTSGATVARSCALLLWIGVVGLAALPAPSPAAETPTAAAAAPASAAADGDDDVPTHSMMDRAMFYELLIADVSLNQGDYGTAYQLYSRNASKAQDERLYALAFKTAWGASDFGEALNAAKTWVKAFPQSPQANEALADTAMRVGRGDLAVAPLRTVIDNAPPAQRNAIILALSRFMLRSGNAAEAAKTLDDVLAPYAKVAGPSQTTAQLALALMWVQAKDYTRGLSLLHTVQAREPANPQVAFIATELMPQLPPADEPRAESLVTAQLNAAPQSNVVRVNYAVVLSELQRLNEAKTQLDTALGDDDTLALGWLRKGEVCRELRQYALSDEAFKRYLRLTDRLDAKATSEDAGANTDANVATVATRQSVYLMLAQSSQEQGKPKQALDWLSKVPPTDDISVVARRASVFIALGRKPEADQLIGDLPEQSRDERQDKFRVQAQVLTDNSQWSAAYELLTQATQQFPNDIGFLYDQAMLADRLGRSDDMERLLKRVIALQPDYQHAYNALGYSLAERNVRLDEARSYVQKALELAPGDPLITDSMGWVEFRSGNDQEALRLVRQAYAKRAEPEIAAHLIEILWRVNQKDEALNIARQTLKLTPHNEDFQATLKRLNINL